MKLRFVRGRGAIVAKAWKGGECENLETKIVRQNEVLYTGAILPQKWHSFKSGNISQVYRANNFCNNTP